MVEILDSNTACEHGHQQRKCPYCQNTKDAARIAQLEAALEKCAEGAFIMQQRGELINVAKQALGPTLRGPSDG